MGGAFYVAVFALPRDEVEIVLRRASGITNRLEVRPAENAATLLPTRPAANPACWTSLQEKGKESSAANGFFGSTIQREPDGISRFSRSRKNVEREPSPGASAMSQACS